MPIATTAPELPAAALYHFWYPERDGVEPCPRAFDEQLKRVHRDLAICRPPGQAPTISHPWLVWYRKPEVTHWLSPGWTMLFCWQTIDKEPLPLDNRVFANLYRISAFEFGSAMKYFESVVKTMKDDKSRASKQDKNDMEDRKKDFLSSRRIKNIGRGSKFALHHDGTVVPSRGESNWASERERDAMPTDVAAKHKDRRKWLESRRRKR